MVSAIVGDPIERELMPLALEDEWLVEASAVLATKARVPEVLMPVARSFPPILPVVVPIALTLVEAEPVDL